MRTNCDITIYNKYISSGADKYQLTVIPLVEWENRKAANTLATGGNINADSATIFIPFARDANYVKPKAWQALSSKTGKWTLQKGDFIVKGVVSDTIHDAVVSPASAAFNISDLKKKYDDVLEISSVDTMDFGSLSLQHWKVSAK